MPARRFIFAAWARKNSKPKFEPGFPTPPCCEWIPTRCKAPGSHDRALTAFREGKVQILLGTQMIAKGLDFPNVTLVGVINADTALHLPDFRAAERTFQLVTQVAGRTGRGEKGGRVLVQTFSPDHPAIRAAVLHDFGRSPARNCRFARRMVIHPPAAMVRVVVRGTIERANQRVCANHSASGCDSAGQLFANAPCARPGDGADFRLRGQYRTICNSKGQTATPFAQLRKASDGLDLPKCTGPPMSIRCDML